MPALAKYEKEDLKAIAYFFKNLEGKTTTADAPKSWRLLDAAASESLKTKWPYPTDAQGAQYKSDGPAISGLFEAPPNLMIDQALMDNLIQAASASAAAQ
jgi:hypothetical protein